jgi:hypothetical protein
MEKKEISEKKINRIDFFIINYLSKQMSFNPFHQHLLVKGKINKPTKEVETLNHLPRGPVTIEEDGPVNLGLWFWSKEPTCFKKCCPLLSETETFILSSRPSNRFPFPWNLLSESQLFPKGSNREVDPTQPITDTFTSRALVWTI